ncbi:unnamed protein product [Euphydryas editha]|uniref:Uncharacterized protein n=1 Tax=Euphydryas editha TaxID=104508 RepID=A0AAU9TPA8_EUPED|nr:unnamed protein product [Euphydryas editha]
MLEVTMALSKMPRYCKNAKVKVEITTMKWITEISPNADDWKREINHVDRLRQQYWESDRVQELNERELVILVGADSESDTDSIFSDSESEISGVESMDMEIAYARESSSEQELRQKIVAAVTSE